MVEDRYIDGALRKVLAACRTDEGVRCPDANQLAAYLEGELSREEMSRVELHAAGCSSCQGLLAIALKTAEQAPLQGEGSPAPRFPAPFFRLAVALPAAAALVLAVGIGYLLLQMKETAEESKAQMAEARPQSSLERDFPAPPPPPAPPRENEVSSVGRDRAVHKGQKPVTGAEIAAGGNILEPADEFRDLDALSKDRKMEVADARRPAAEGSAERQSGARAGGVVGGIMAPRSAEEKRADQAAAPVFAVTESPAAPQQASSAKTLAAAATGGESSRARDLLRRLAAESGEKFARESARTVGGRRFFMEGGHWIDLECLGHPEADLIACKPGSAELVEVLEALPELADLQREGAPVLLFWSGRILLIRLR